MKTLSLGLIGVNGHTTKSYVQKLAQHGYYFKEIIIIDNIKIIGFKANLLSTFLGSNFTKTLISNRQIKKYKHLNPYQSLFNEAFGYEFNFLENLKYQKFCKKYKRIGADSINDDLVLKELSQSSASTFVFSGGGIIKKPIFDLGKKFIHTHPGYLPYVRGSHGIYWSLLKRKKFGCTTFYMNEGIDTGKIIFRKEFDKSVCPRLDCPPNVSDQILLSFLDPLIRSETLFEVIKMNEDFHNLPTIPVENEEPETFYTMHKKLRYKIASKF